MHRSAIETVIGAVVLVVAAMFLYFIYNTGYQNVEGYRVTAKFNRVDGLAVGSDVRLSGIKVGRVVATRLDTKTYLAVIEMRIDRSVKLPVDTTAKITSDSLLSGNYVSLEPGGEEKLIPDGGEIVATQDPINISDLIGRYIFGSASAAKPARKGQPGHSEAPQPEKPQPEKQPQPAGGQ
jgi:phospholipid/cholesterol/gamma-HCH transport system substrate-binding protein